MTTALAAPHPKYGTDTFEAYKKEWNLFSCTRALGSLIDQPPTKIHKIA